MELKRLAKIFKALSSEQRLKCLQIIRQMEGPDHEGAPKAFSKCCEELNLSPSTISHHIKELEHAGIIETEKQGQSVCCRVNTEAWVEIQKFM